MILLTVKNGRSMWVTRLSEKYCKFISRYGVYTTFQLYIYVLALEILIKNICSVVSAER